MLLKRLKAATTRVSPDTRAGAQPDFPLEMEARFNELHARAPIRRHLEILHGDLTIGGELFTNLYFRCLEETGTAVTPFNVFQRFQTRADLVRYFVATLPVPGARVECGAYRGATALLLCRTWRSEHGNSTGEGFFLIDSFSGTSASTEHDLIAVRDAMGVSRMEPFFPTGKTDVTVDEVKGYFSEFPGARILQGWIPAVFSNLPETDWAFVHLDLTLYEPTLAALRYFYSKLNTGGVIICDGSAFCPGAQKAINEFSTAQNIAYVTLGHREAVFIKP